MTDIPRRRLVYATTIVVAVVWTLLDQATKTWAVRALEGGQPNDLGPVVLRVIRNDGGAFSLPIDLPWVFVIVTVIVLVLVVRALPETTSLRLAAAYGLVVGGAVGNAADRIFRDSGAVVDMIDLDFPPLQEFPVFNVADAGITVGAVLVALLLLLAERSAKRKSAPVVLDEPEDAEVSVQVLPPPPAGAAGQEAEREAATPTTSGTVRRGDVPPPPPV